MYLSTQKIFALSKNKRLFNRNNPQRLLGIYDVERLTYSDAQRFAQELDCSVSILLGPVQRGCNLICLDLDDCFLETGELEPKTKNFLEQFDDSEYEVSSSGEGIHIYILTSLNLDTFIVKELEGCKSFECYTKDRHIVTTWCDFENTNFKIGKHDKFISDLYGRVREQRAKPAQTELVKTVFQGKEISGDMQAYSEQLGLGAPVTDMYTLRGLGYKDSAIIRLIDANPDSVDQSAHDVGLIRKLCYYTKDFNLAWELAQKTNYYKAKDDSHKRKFNTEKYKQGIYNLIF